MNPDPRFWANKRVLVTGCTGFKGSWLSYWLTSMGANVMGYSLAPPTEPNLFTQSGLSKTLEWVNSDLGDLPTMVKTFQEFSPEVVFHLAAQPLVLDSYRDPLGTYRTNVMGTVHLLEAVRLVESVRSTVIVTSDKCYENREVIWGYRETDPMGGHDPYSNSKGCAELIVNAYRMSFFVAHGQGRRTAVGSGRAGNVIGGGDYSFNRLVPDIIRSFQTGKDLEIRNPTSIRPWQHVLEPLNGYLILAEKLWSLDPVFESAWNFGPMEEDVKPVDWIVQKLQTSLGGKSKIIFARSASHEAQLLKLDATKARTYLGWKPRWHLEKTLEKIVQWELDGRRKSEIIEAQIKEYLDDDF